MVGEQLDWRHSVGLKTSEHVYGLKGDQVDWSHGWSHGSEPLDVLGIKMGSSLLKVLN